MQILIHRNTLCISCMCINALCICLNCILLAWWPFMPQTNNSHCSFSRFLMRRKRTRRAWLTEINQSTKQMFKQLPMICLSYKWRSFLKSHNSASPQDQISVCWRRIRLNVVLIPFLNCEPRTELFSIIVKFEFVSERALKHLCIKAKKYIYIYAW